MRVILQRVSEARVDVAGQTVGRIGCGLLILVGVARGDSQEDVVWLAGKIARMRLFNDERGQMNLDLAAVGGDILVISQFTLHAAMRKGNRPSYLAAAPPEE